MIYLFRLLDRPDGAVLRQRVRPEHKAYLAQVADLSLIHISEPPRPY